MGRRGLYSTLGTTQITEAVRIRKDILAYCDGLHSVLEISELLGRPAWVLAPYFAELVEHDLISEVDLD
jgi:aminopeptidase-like protein